MSSMAGAPTLSDLASAIGVHSEEVAIVAELKAGSEDAFAWLIAQYSQPVYSLVYRVLEDPSDASDTTQEVFIKVFRGVKGFNANASLKTWIYRIALREAFNQRRWWFRHRGRETSIEPVNPGYDGQEGFAVKDTLVDETKSPFENAFDSELRARVETELRLVPEPYRTTLILRDIEELSYEQVAEVMDTSLGTVKSRLMRGREALRKRLSRHLHSFGVEVRQEKPDHHRENTLCQEVEVLP
jgi:RNA polymerase sigma-70 factor (ECF subfamily)